MRAVVTTCLLLGCATAGRDRAIVDGKSPPTGDSRGGDAATAQDTGCSITASDLLTNGSFDSAPMGTGWSSTPANPLYPIITTNGVAPQSAPAKAWMGSFASATDDMHEDVMIPASTTSLVVAGFYQVRTVETGATVADTAKVDLADASGTSLESAVTLDNTQATTAWMPFTYTVSGSFAGQTVRLRFATINNATKPTSFYFDSVSLQASYCR